MANTFYFQNSLSGTTNFFVHTDKEKIKSFLEYVSIWSGCDGTMEIDGVIHNKYEIDQSNIRLVERVLRRELHKQYLFEDNGWKFLNT